MRSTFSLMALFFLLAMMLVVSGGCTCGSSGDDDDDCPACVDDDDDDTTVDDDDDDDNDDNDDDNDDDDDMGQICRTFASYESGDYFMPIRVTLSTNCDADIFYMRERFDGSGDPTYIQGFSPIHDIYIDRDTTLKFYSVNSDGYTEQLRTEIYDFPPKFDGLLFLHAGDLEVTLQWDEAWDKDSPITYNIYKPGSEPIPTMTPIATTMNTEYTVTTADTTLQTGRSACFVVRAVDSLGLEDQNYTKYCIVPETVLYVDVAAPAGGDGSMANPFNSIQAANDSVPETRYLTNVWVAGGIYNEVLDFTLNDPPYTSHICHLQISGGFDPTDWSRDLINNPTSVRGNGGSYTWKVGDWDVIDGFQVTSGQVGILLQDIHSATIRNTVAHQNTDYGIMIDSRDAAAGQSIVNNLVVLNGNGIGIRVVADDDGEANVNPLIRNNIIYANSGGGVVGIGTGNGIYPVNLNARIYNCVIQQNIINGVSCSIYGTNINAMFEIFNDFIGDNGTDLECINCATNTFELYFSDILDPGAYTGVGLMSVPPMFQSAPSEFQLQLDSPLIDAGMPDALFNDPDGTRNDIGAFGGVGGRWKPQPFLK